MAMVIPIYERTLLICDCCGRENVAPASVSICEVCDRLLHQAAVYRTENDVEQARLSGWV